MRDQVPLKVHHPLEQRGEVFRQLWFDSVFFEKYREAFASHEAGGWNTHTVAQCRADLGRTGATFGQFDRLFGNLFRGERDPCWIGGRVRPVGPRATLPARVNSGHGAPTNDVYLTVRGETGPHFSRELQLHRAYWIRSLFSCVCTRNFLPSVVSWYRAATPRCRCQE